ncbi:hypothetical protein TNCV_2320671 [Trichonephila clavipes]|nr:hypothetical protein TNCV_2320671 [Trichonephila clavipes]
MCQHIVPRKFNEDQSADEVISASQAYLKDMAENRFQKCFDDRYNPWQKFSPGTFESYYLFLPASHIPMFMTHKSGWQVYTQITTKMQYRVVI